MKGCYVYKAGSVTLAQIQGYPGARAYGYLLWIESLSMNSYMVEENLRARDIMALIQTGMYFKK